MPQRFTNPVIKYTTDTLKTLPGALLYFYENGTSTPKVVYQDVGLTTPHAPPVVADSAGNFPPIFLDGTYRAELKNSAGVTQSAWPVDNVGGEQIEGAFDSYSAITSYLEGDIVTGSNGLYYISQQDENLNNDPTIIGNRPTWWAELKITSDYNPTSTYDPDEWVTYNGEWYKCILQATGQTPADPSIYWVPIWKTIENLNTVLSLSGGGNLTARYAHELNDSLTYTLPLANSVPPDTVLIAGKNDTKKGENPVVQRSGSDIIRYGGGTDTALRFSAAYSHSLRFVSNGTDEWSI